MDDFSEEKEKLNKKEFSPSPSFDKIYGWNSKIEKAVKLIEKQCRLYRKMHTEVSIETNERYSNFMLSAIIITPFSGIVTTIGSIFCKDLEHLYIYNITSTLLSFFSGILVTIIKFNKYDEISYAHKTASSRYISLEENIKRQLILYREDRINANEYLTWLSKSFDELFFSAPDFESKTLKKYERQLEEMEREYDKVEINYNKQESCRNLKFQQYQDLNKFDDETMRLEIKKV
jgi:hypothetical protein